MSAALKPRKVTLEEYFAIEERAERKSEYHNGEMILMAGASREHNILSRNLTVEIYLRLKGTSCYKQLPAVQEYLLVSQDEPLVERFTRQSDGAWGKTDFVGLEVEMALSTVPLSVPMADVYRGVEFPDPSRQQ